MSITRYVGVDSRGVGRCGATRIPPAAFAQRCHRLGWFALTMTRGGTQVGGITGPSSLMAASARTWWGEEEQ